MRRSGDSRCPGVVEMYEAEDGWLVRVRLPGGRATAEQLAAIAVVASRGSGLVDITRRANVQIRGLTNACGPAAASTLAAAGLLPAPEHERLRNIVASPFGGRHPQSVCDTDALVEDLDRALCADDRLRSLPDRFLFGVDDGSGVLRELDLDVALVAEARDVFRMWIGGSMTNALAPRARAAAVAVAAARSFLAVRGTAWRVRELDGGAASVAERVGATVVESPGAEPVVVRPGVCAQRDARVAITALAPLGRLDRTTLGSLADIAPEVRFSPWRTVTIVDVPAREAGRLAASMAALGLQTSSGSGWECLTACVGVGACAKARVDVRASVERRAAVREPGAPAEHWSACERRCGEPRAVPIGVVADDAGLTVTVAGRATRAPDARHALDRLRSGR